MRSFMQGVLTLEPVAYVIMAIAVWASPIVGMFALPLVIPIFAARWIVHRRLWTRTPLDVPLLALAIIAVINWQVAPYPVSLTTLSPLLFGIVLVFGIIETARRRGIDGLLFAAVIVTLWFCASGLTTTDWHEVKSWQLLGIIRLIPVWDTSSLPLYVSFNPNTLSLLLSWLIPLMAGIAVYARSNPLLRAFAVIAFTVGMVILLLAQAQFVIFAVLLVLIPLALLILPRGRWQIAAVSVIVLAGLFELGLFTQVTAAPEQRATQIERDNFSLSARQAIWGRAITMIAVHPLTGVGMNRFPSGAALRDFPMEYAAESTLVHAHNLVLQTWVDFGVFGVLALAGIYAAAVWMLRRVWSNGSPSFKVIAVGIACGLAAYALSTTVAVITFWHHFAFVFWLMVGLVGAVYVVSAGEAHAKDI